MQSNISQWPTTLVYRKAASTISLYRYKIKARNLQLAREKSDQSSSYSSYRIRWTRLLNWQHLSPGWLTLWWICQFGQWGPILQHPATIPPVTGPQLTWQWGLGFSRLLQHAAEWLSFLLKCWFLGSPQAAPDFLECGPRNLHFNRLSRFFPYPLENYRCNNLLGSLSPGPHYDLMDGFCVLYSLAFVAHFLH